ncbi:MAG: hypothetical protein KDD35_01495, partial [Bdellovibrionales bacterium]|nr:hypothetical protein [Bdellovibrionales bacterium]
LRSSINDLSSSRSPLRRMDSLALWNWGKRNDQTLRRLVLSMKGQKGLECFRLELVQWLIARRNWSLEEERKNWVIIPAPSRSEGQKEHAVRLAEEIAKALGKEMAQPLLREANAKVQRRLDRLNRYRSIRSGMQLKLDSKKYSSVLFVDDIVTTGATAQRARELLGYPQDFQVWSLARREEILFDNTKP